MEGEAKSSVEVFPELVWTLIFKYLEDPEDFISCFNTCRDFRRLLSSQRVSFLFPNVFPLLLAKGLDSKAPKSERPRGTHLNGDHDRVYFNSKLIWLRSVCRIWKHGMDTHFKSWKYFEDHYNDELPRFNPFKFMTTNEMLEFTTKMSGDTNPFLNGLVEFDDAKLRDSNQVQEDLRRYWDFVTSSFLPEFGGHISYLYLSTDEMRWSGLPLSYFYEKLSQILNLVPELLALDVSSSIGEDDDDDDDDDDDNFLQQVVLNKPLAQFRHLRLLSIKSCSVPVTNELLRVATNSKQLKILHVDFEEESDESAEFHDSFLEHKLPTLEGLEELGLPEFLSSSLLQKLPTQIPSTLKCLLLTAQLSAGEQQNHITLRKLFEVLNAIGGRCPLRELDLDVSTCYITDLPLFEPDLRLELPLLESLSISVSADVKLQTLDFAAELKSLKELRCSLISQSVREENAEEEIRFSGYAHRMKESNIWEKLPQLKVLETNDGLKFNKYCRFETGIVQKFD